MNGIVALFALLSLRFPLYVVASMIGLLVWGLGGFAPIPWVSALVGSVVVGSIVTLAKPIEFEGSVAPSRIAAAVVLTLCIDAALIAGIVQFGFGIAFVSWGIAHLAAILVASVFGIAASGALMQSSSSEEAEAWIFARFTVFGLAGVIAVFACAGIR